MTIHSKKSLQKRILIVAAGLLAATGHSGSQAANSATASATAVVLVPIAVSKITDLSFGRLVAGNGTVTLDTSGARTLSGSTPLPTGGTATAARFDVTGDTTNTFSISYTGSSSVLSDGTPADDMNVTWIAEALTTATGSGKTALTQDATGTLASGAAYIFVGASLAVGASQPAGTYTGTIQVTVDYN
ncbi:MAG TPA: DUF4402 domain-containing protein [Burkholderiaceae bacterium]|jgi:spore coat protein U-like protein